MKQEVRIERTFMETKMAVQDVKNFFEELNTRLQGNPDRAKKIGGVYGFIITGDQEGTYKVDLPNAAVTTGDADGATVTIKMTDETMLQILNREINEMQAFTQGKLKVKGNPMAAMKLRDVLNPKGW